MGVCFLLTVFVVVQLESTEILEAALKGGCGWNYSFVSDNGVLGQQGCIRQTKSQMDGNIEHFLMALHVGNMLT